MFFHILGAIAEFEHALMSERTMDGLAAARARGRTGGQKPKLGPRQVKLAREMYDETGEDGKRSAHGRADRGRVRREPPDDLPPPGRGATLRRRLVLARRRALRLFSLRAAGAFSYTRGARYVGCWRTSYAAHVGNGWRDLSVRARERVLAALRAQRDEQGVLSARVVREAAIELGCSSTVGVALGGDRPPGSAEPAVAWLMTSCASRISGGTGTSPRSAVN